MLIVEPKEDGNDHDEALINTIWPTVETVNASLPSHVQIHRDMVIIASSSKKFERAAKGNVVRMATGRLFEKEVDELFRREREMVPVGPA